MSRRGGILLETVLALALFAGGAIFVLQSVRDGIAALDRSRNRQEAVDLARSAIARLEAGLINLEDLRQGQLVEGSGDWFDDGAFGESNGGDISTRYVIEALTSRSPYPGLTLVEVRISAAEAGDGSRPGPLLCTLRQLVRLRQGAEDDGFLPDEIMEDLPDAAPDARSSSR